MTASLVLDFTGSSAANAHSLKIGDVVTVTKWGVVQPWGVVTIARLTRNRTYRLAFGNGTFVTAHEDELVLVP